MKKQETISIILPVYNAKNTIKRCIDSIIKQTEKDWKLVAINDGSTDGTKDILNYYEDKFENISICNLEKNMGLVYALNKGLELSKGKFIARMDADDEMLPDRLKQQLEVFKIYKDVDVCGMSSVINKKSVRLNFSSHDEIIESLHFSNPIIHPTVMIRVSNKLKIQYTNVVCEDYDLWTRLAMQGAIFININKPGIIYNKSLDQKSIREKHLVANAAILIAEKYSEFTSPMLRRRLEDVKYTFDKINSRLLKKELSTFKDKNIFKIDSVNIYYLKRVVKRAVYSLNYKSIYYILYFFISTPHFISKLLK
jgi:glycosyltransferase involved in cell wall biosynthesis